VGQSDPRDDPSHMYSTVLSISQGKILLELKEGLKRGTP
jgi:hypothetical protein